MDNINFNSLIDDDMVYGPKIAELIKKLQGGVGKAGASLGKAGDVIGKGLTGAGESLISKSGNLAGGVIDTRLVNLGKMLKGAGAYTGSNPGMALGGAALGGLNLAGLADEKDILMQLLAGAGGAGLGYAKGGIPGAVMGGLGGGVAGDMLPKLVRMLQGE
jgi:hypothetical protein